VIFVTLFIVLLTEANGPVTIAFTAERLGSTLAGGALALLAALFFWPVWERDRFPPVLAQALRGNRDYLQLLASRITQGGAYDAPAVAAKRRAESANSAVFSSLQRMIGDPKNRQEGIEQAAALANGNQRLTRALNVITLHLTSGIPMQQPEVEHFARLAIGTLDALAADVIAEGTAPAGLAALLTELENFRFPSPGPDSADATAQQHHWVFAQLIQASTELGAMILAATGPDPDVSPVVAAA